MGHEAPRPNRLAGIDALRFAALAAIFTQHVCSVTDLEGYAVVGGFRVGRFGTAVFFALSGYFAAASHLPPGVWLVRRAAHLLPAFWVVTAVGFVAAAATGRREFDGWQVACQMAGIGPFTHPDRLVNVVTWFVGLLIPLYLLVYLARRTREGMLVWLAVTAGCYAVYPYRNQFDVMACQAVTFFAGYALGRTGGRLTGLPLSYAVVMAALVPLQPEFVYGVTALALLRTAVAVRADWPAGRASARYAYEWFLVHGLCLHAARAAVGPQVWVVAPVAVALGLVAAVGLKEGLDRLLGRRGGFGRITLRRPKRFVPLGRVHEVCPGSTDREPVSDRGA